MTVSRLDDRYKGHDVILAALPAVRDQVPDVRWVVVGDGALLPELRRRAGELGVGDAIEFRGNVSDEERDAALLASHVFCMPSRRPEHGIGEGFGIVYLEAGAHGLPVVAGAVPGVVDAVVDGHTGLLVDPADPGSVARAIVDVLGDPDLADRLGGAGVARAREQAWPTVANRYRQVLDEVLGARPAGRRAPDRGWLRDLALGPAAQ